MHLASVAQPPPLREDAHGVIRVGETRVTLESLVAAYDQGAGAEELALRFPSLGLAAIHAALGFYLSHQQLLQPYLEQQQRASAELRQRLLQRRDG